jgi:hypothetical protein
MRHALTAMCLSSPDSTSCLEILQHNSNVDVGVARNVVIKDVDLVSKI